MREFIYTNFQDAKSTPQKFKPETFMILLLLSIKILKNFRISINTKRKKIMWSK